MNHLDSLMKWTERRKALPAKISQEPVTKPMLATCPLILNLIGPHSSSIRSWGRKAD